MMEITQSFYTQCRLCGRECGIDRAQGKKGFCGGDFRLKIAWAGIHHGEEPPICGTGGSGTIFVSGCTLKCFFCQNHQISHGGAGRPVSSAEFSKICLMLQEKGAENINIVTGTHFIPSLAAGIAEAKRKGLRLPVLWNSSGYEQADMIHQLDAFIDIYLPDLKTLDTSLSSALFGVSDYPKAAAAAIREMAASRPLRYRQESLVSGLIVRHLVLPGLIENTREVLAWFAENLAGRALLSLMFQFVSPAQPLPGDRNIPGEWTRRISPGEYRETLDMLDYFGIEEGFVQELPEDNLLPDFSRAEAFPGGLADPLWFYGGPGAE